ncbi:MAG: hypothetical protein P8X63_11330 [Desulfuromonadaceae bacterium]
MGPINLATYRDLLQPFAEDNAEALQSVINDLESGDLETPVCRLRFDAATRRYYFNLPFFHELDPRATRTAINVHAVFRPDRDGWYRRRSDERR